jgi:hypothetical protein
MVKASWNCVQKGLQIIVRLWDLVLRGICFRTIRVAAENGRDPAVRLRVDRFDHARLGDVAGSNQSPSELFLCLTHKLGGNAFLEPKYWLCKTRGRSIAVEE